MIQDQARTSWITLHFCTCSAILLFQGKPSVGDRWSSISSARAPAQDCDMSASLMNMSSSPLLCRVALFSWCKVIKKSYDWNIFENPSLCLPREDVSVLRWPPTTRWKRCTCSPQHILEVPQEKLETHRKPRMEGGTFLLMQFCHTWEWIFHTR